MARAASVGERAAKHLVNEKVHDGEAYLPVLCWCAQHVVYVPKTLVRRGRTLACGPDCG